MSVTAIPAPADRPIAAAAAATVAALNRGFDGVLAPSRFVAKALLDSGLTRPVHVIGQAPDLTAFEAVARHRVPDAGRPFTFLHVSSCFPRKGVDVLLQAYAAAFRRTDPVRLVIKGFPNPHNTVPEQVAALQARDPDAPGIEVINQDLDLEAMLDLYRDADAMVLPTRGEGLNLPAAEAMAAGLPLIVTGYGGHLDFCDARTARLLRYRLQPSGSHLATPGSLWAEPDPDDLAAALRDAAALPEGALPDVPRGRDGARPSPALVALLKVLLAAKCEEHNVAPKLLASGEDLDRLAGEDTPDVPALQGWRREMFGADALALKAGEITLGVMGKRVKLVRVG